jgi:hypothetical protein
MKKVALAILLIAVIAVGSGTCLILNQNVEQTPGGAETENNPPNENQTCNVRIADFKWTSKFEAGPGGVLWGRNFNITLQNTGYMDVEGISVDIKLLANNTTEIWSETGLYGPGKIGYTPYPNGFDGKLNASEIRELRGGFHTGLDKLEQARDWGPKTYLVRVMVNSTISDELTLPDR